MKRKIIGIFIIAVVFTSTAVLAQRPVQQNFKAQKRGMRFNNEQGTRGEFQSFLSEEQKEAAKNLRLEAEKELKPLQNQLRELEVHQRTLSTSADADLNVIYKNIDKISEVKSEIEKVKAKQHQGIRNLLNEEQLLSFDRADMGQRKGRTGNENFRRNRLERMDRPPFQKGE